MACPLATERVWTDKVQYHAAEKQYHEYLSKLHNTGIRNETNSEIHNTNQVNEADGLRFKSPVKKISKNQRKRQQRGSAADEDGNLDATVSDSPTTRDVKLDVKKNSKKQRNVPQTSDVAKPKEKSNGGKNKARNLPQQSSIEDESLTESIAQEIKSPMKKTRTNNRGKILLQPSSDEVFPDLLGDEPPQKPQNRNPNQSKRVQQQRANYDSNELAEQKPGPHKKELKNKPNGNETDSMKRQKNKQNNKKNSVWSDDDRNLPSTVEEKNEHKSPGFESSLKTIDELSVSLNTVNVSVSAQAHPDDAENRNEEQFIEVPNKRKRSRRAKKDKQVASLAAFVANDGKTNSSRSDSISSIDIQSVDFVIAEEVADKTKDIKEFQNIVNQKKSSDNFALKESNDNCIYDTVVNVVDNILKEQVKNRGAGPSSLASEIAKARQHIKNSLERMDGIAALASTPSAELLDRLSFVEKQNALLQTTVNNLQDIVGQLEEKIRALELSGGKPTVQTANTSSQVTKSPPAPAAAPKPTEDDDDDGVDLFGSDSEDEDEAAAKVREQRLADYAAKKSKKQALIAKSNIILDIKPWSDETDMKEMEKEVRAIKMDGLLWGAAKLVPLAYGIHKLQISTVVEDDKVSIDALQEEITNIEELVQSVDIAAFNKI